MRDTVRHRQNRVLELVKKDAFISVQELSSRLDVSPLTVRRDLSALQEKGLIERLHGGARVSEDVLVRADKSELSFYYRLESRVQEKQAIARAAVNLLTGNEVILLDASTTGLLFARSIPNDLPLTIVTHSAYLPVALADCPELQVISTGGILHRKSLCYLGFEAEASINQFHTHYAFFGVKGFSLKDGCTDASLLEIKLKALMLQRTEKLVILADHTKIGNIGLASFAPASRVDILITDDKADVNILKAVEDQGVRIIIAPITGQDFTRQVNE